MKTRKNQKRSTDVLYKVDPKKLSIKLCYTSTAANYVAEQTTTFESFSFEKVEMKPEIPEQIGQLPAFVDGVFFFATEEEAQRFIRTQIGM